MNLEEDRTVLTEHKTEFGPIPIRYLTMLSKFYLLVVKFYNLVKILIYFHENDTQLNATIFQTIQYLLRITLHQCLLNKIFK